MRDINTRNSRIIPLSFEYYAPTTLENTIKILKNNVGKTKVLAGGTDLIPKMKQRTVEPEILVNLKKIKTLKGIKKENNIIHIGSLTKLREIEESNIINDVLPLLAFALNKIGSVQIRNMATIGGNVCNASPSADGAVALISLDAEVKIIGHEKETVMPLYKFFTGPGETVLNHDEILAEIMVPVPPERYGWNFVKVGRTQLDLAMVSVAITISLKNKRIKHCRISFGSVAPKPLRAIKIEDYLKGKQITETALNKVEEIVEEIVKPITDVRGTKEYRIRSIKAIVRSVLLQSIGKKGELIE